MSRALNLSGIPGKQIDKPEKGNALVFFDQTTGKISFMDDTGTVKPFTDAPAAVIGDGVAAGTDPVNAVASAAKLTASDNFLADETIEIGGVTYTFLADPTGVVNAVDLGGSLSVSLDNLKAAIDASGTPDTEYGTGTVANPLVSGGTKTATTLIVTAKIAGVSGDLIAVDVTSAGDAAWDDTVLGTEVAGVDGTVGLVGEVRWSADGTTFYLCPVANTVADANWVQSTMTVVSA